MLRITADELPRFMACNGSHKMGIANPPSVGDTTARDEGTAAHYMATQVSFGKNTIAGLIDKKASNGVFMTAEMGEYVSDYLDAIGQPEGWFEYDTTHDNSPHWIVPGRTDYIHANKEAETLRVVDFKYGYRIVEPQHHWTLVSHALGYIKAMNFAPKRIDLQIFQPRPYHPDGPLRTWTIDYVTLTQLYAQMNNTLCHPADMLHTSNHCNKCRSLAICPAARAAEMNSIDASDIVYNDTINNAELAFILENLSLAENMIEQRKKAFEELAKHRISTGQVVENYAVETSLGNSRFMEGITVEALKVITGKDLSVPKLCTPAEAKRRGVGKLVIENMTYRPRTGEKLVRIDANKKAQRLFGHGPEK